MENPPGPFAEQPATRTAVRIVARAAAPRLIAEMFKLRENCSFIVIPE
jgi:hypothetical protein